MASLQDAEGGNVAAAAPPASKHAVKSLVREVLSEERLQQLGVLPLNVQFVGVYISACD